MRNFWPSFFGFLGGIATLIGLYRPDLADNALLFLGAWLAAALYIVLVALAAAGLMVAYLALRKQQLAANRPVDGAFPLQRFRTRAGNIIFNPNHMLGPATLITHDGHYTELEPPAGWSAAAALRALVERTNALRAIYPGDQVRMNQYGAMSANPRPGPNPARALETNPTAPPPAGPPPAPKSLPAPARVDPANAIHCAAPGEAPLGVTAQGEIVYWRLAAHPHLRIHGSSQGSGKTNLAQTALVALALQGAHIAILDRRRFKDFREFQRHAELIDTADPQNALHALQRLVALYQERDQLLGRAGAANIDELRQRFGELSAAETSANSVEPLKPRLTSSRLPRYGVLITEFGSLCITAEEAGMLPALQRCLALILREAGAAGIHIIFEDQVVERGKWPRGVAANATPITGHLPLNLGAAGGYHHAHELQPYQFHHAGAIFHSWDMRPLTARLLATAPPYNPGLALQPPSVPAAERSTPPQPPVHGGRGGVGGMERTEHVAARALPARPIAQAATGNGLHPENEPKCYWEIVAAEWFRDNPDALTGPARGISALARAMASHREGKEDNYEAYKGRAHKLYHAFRGRAQRPL